MKKIRFLALLCAAALIVALFAGCGSSSAFETKPEETKTSETAKPAETEAEPEYEVTLNVAHVQSDGDNVAQAYALALKEACKKYGIKIEIFAARRQCGAGGRRSDGHHRYQHYRHGGLRQAVCAAWRTGSGIYLEGLRPDGRRSER